MSALAADLARALDAVALAAFPLRSRARDGLR
jgi:hypothetical protein